MSKQIEALEAGAQIVVGTPGRVLDHLRQKTLDPSGVRVLVLDEADEMLSMGFARELHAILETLPKNRQGLFFSATIPPDIERLAHAQLKNPEFITLSSDQVGALEIAHYVYVLRQVDKRDQLVRILEVEDPESAVIFCNTRDETQRVAEALKARGFDADWLNGDLPQNDRERVMAATREGRLRFLVATDVAARGIDISHLTHVINHDFPETAEQYVHRTGRTGRAGRTGTAISIIGPKDIGNLYLLRLTYKIRPIEKQLPSAGELKTRAEMDVAAALRRRVRRARRAPRRPLARAAPAHPRGRRADRRRPAARPPRRARRRRRRPRRPKRGAPAIRRPSRPRETCPRPCERPASQTRPAANAERAARPARRRPSRDEPRRREPRREPRSRDARERDARSAPASFARWQPPHEADDDRPILRAPPDATIRRRGSRASPCPIASAKPPTARRRAASAEDMRARASDDGFLQLFVNVGKRDGVRASDLQKLLSDRGVAVDPAAGIRMRDRMTFVRVPKELFDDAVAALSGQVLGGRTVVAELARGSRA